MASLTFERETVAAAPRRPGPAFTVNALVAGLRHGWSEGSLTVIGPDGAAHRIEGGRARAGRAL